MSRVRVWVMFLGVNTCTLYPRHRSDGIPSTTMFITCVAVIFSNVLRSEIWLTGRVVVLWAQNARYLCIEFF